MNILFLNCENSVLYKLHWAGCVELFFSCEIVFSKKLFNFVKEKRHEFDPQIKVSPLLSHQATDNMNKANWLLISQTDT